MDKNNPDPTIVKIYNTKQAGLYIKHNVEPIDLFYNDGTLIFVFDKAETNSIYTKWLSHTLFWGVLLCINVEFLPKT